MAPKPGSIAHATGGFGHYHLAYVALAFTRHALMAMISHSGQLLTPDVEFNCLLEHPSCEKSSTTIGSSLANNTSSYTNQCYTKLADGSESLCPYREYNLQTYGRTLTSEYDLVCDRAKLRSFYDLSLALGVAIASLVVGPLSDRYGRNTLVQLAYIFSLQFNVVALVAADYGNILLGRMVSLVCDYAVASALVITMSEICAPKQRVLAQIFIFTGNSLGVAIMPWVVEYCHDFRVFFKFYLTAHTTTGVWLWFVRESPSWQMAMAKYGAAKQNLKALHEATWFDKLDESFEQKFARTHNRYLCKAVGVELKSLEMNPLFQGVLAVGNSLAKIGEFFTSRQLACALLSLFLVSFVTELHYMLFILFNMDLGNSVKLNYALGYAMDIGGALASVLMVHTMPRRWSLVLPFAILALSSFALGPLDLRSELALMFANVAKFAIASARTIVVVAAIEHFPTSYRHTGLALTLGVGALGAGAAPFIERDLVALFGLQSVLFTLGGLSLLACLVALLLKETKGAELPESIDELDEL